MPTGTATITAKSGPSIQNTALPLTGVTLVTYDVDRNVLFVQQGSARPIKEFDLTGVTTATITISGGNFAFVVS
jgi:hypothetical protein